MPEVPRSQPLLCPLLFPIKEFFPMSNEIRRFNVAVVGATGAVGETMRTALGDALPDPAHAQDA